MKGPDGQEQLAQILSRTEDTAKIAFWAKVPSVGFAVFDVIPTSGKLSEPPSGLTVSETGLSNWRYDVKLDAKGNVSSIYDKQVKRELLSAPHRLAFVEDSPGYWPAWNIDWDDQSSAPKGYVDGPAQIRVVENGPVRVAVEVAREAQGSRFVQRISLAAGDAGERVEFHNLIDWRSKSCNLKAVFPLAATNPLATYSWEAGTLQRGNNDEKKYEVPTHQWFDLTDSSGQFGATVLCPFKYGSDKPDDSTLRLTLLRTPGPILNKEGAVNFDYADQCSQDWGRHEISYALAGHAGDWRKAQTDWQAYRLEQPLLAFQTERHAGELGRDVAIMNIDNPRVRLLALKKAEDSGAVIARLVELSGAPAEDVGLHFATAVLNVTEVDGQERPLGKSTPAAASKLTTSLHPYGLRSLALQPRDPAAARVAASEAPVALPYDTSVATRDGEMATGGFDGNGRCLAAEMLPQTIEDGGVTFQLAPGGSGLRNAVTCNGQSIALPAGEYNRLYLLAAATPADQAAEFTVDGQPTALAIQDWGGFIGQWDNRVWEGEIPETAFQWPFKLTTLTPAYVKRAPVAWFASHRHNSDGRNDIYEYSYLYRYSLDLEPGREDADTAGQQQHQAAGRFSRWSPADLPVRPAAVRHAGGPSGGGFRRLAAGGAHSLTVLVN